MFLIWYFSNLFDHNSLILCNTGVLQSDTPLNIFQEAMSASMKFYKNNSYTWSFNTKHVPTFMLHDSRME